MWILAEFRGSVLNVWRPDRFILDVVEKIGSLGPNQVWAQIDADGPYHAVTPIHS